MINDLAIPALPRVHHVRRDISNSLIGLTTGDRFGWNLPRSLIIPST